MSGPLRIEVAEVTAFVAALFEAGGLEPNAAGRVADALVEADASGRSSHGILQAEAYLFRLIDGTMSTASRPQMVSEQGGAIVLDAADIEGHLAAEEAVKIAVAKAREFGVAAVAVRRMYHCGVTGRYVRQAAEAGCAAFAMCNVRPVMAAPGGTEPLFGTNPLAIAFPVKDDSPVVLDMATTTGAVGKIRQKLAAGEELPPDWALDANGNPTTDPAAALGGLMLPLGGVKGFGLAFVIDMLSGALSSGGWGPTLGAIRGEKVQNSAFLIIALDIERFRPLEAFMEEARSGVERVRNSKKAAGTERLLTPGERSAEAIATNDGTIPVSRQVAEELRACAAQLGVPVPAALEA